MEATFTDPMNETRKRDLGGTDLSPPELLKKIEQVTSFFMSPALKSIDPF